LQEEINSKQTKKVKVRIVKLFYQIYMKSNLEKFREYCKFAVQVKTRRC